MADPLRTHAPVLFVGLQGSTDVATHLFHGAREEGITSELVDYSRAFGSGLMQKILWRVADHRPMKRDEVARGIVDRAHALSAGTVLVTGIAPLQAHDLVALGDSGITRVNFLTDDPWNSAVGSRWFRRSLPHYDFVFTPRRANIDQLRSEGCRSVTYLPFAYSRQVHHPALASDPKVAERDIVFIGGADRDRLPFIDALVEAGFSVALYGGYWHRIKRMRSIARGHADLPTVRAAVASAKVTPALVRRSNRDGISMRTFELAAMGGSLIAEDTSEHRELFGRDGEMTYYFSSPEGLVAATQTLLASSDERTRVAQSCRQRVTEAPNTYRDRLRTMLEKIATDR